MDRFPGVPRVTANFVYSNIDIAQLKPVYPWDPKYVAVLSSNDPGETAKDGGLLVARHGKGVFIYTGLSWFRQLPAGVPGAWRMFANLVSPVP